MTNEPVWKEDADRLSSDWIDGPDADAAPADTSSPHLPENDAAQHYVADMLLVDAMLADMADGAFGEQEGRIRKVMDAIHDPAPTARLRKRFVRWSSLAAVAACLVIAVTLFWIQLSQKSLANEVLLAVNQVSAAATDRVYRIRRVLATTNDDNLPQGRLYLRGRSGFVITCGAVVLGRNGDQFWLVAPGQQVTLSEDFRWIDARSTDDELGLRIMQELSIESRHVPLMQLASVAELMQHDYGVTLSRSRFEGRSVDLLVGQRQSARTELPTTIRLWADVDSRIIQRADLSWGEDNAIILELAQAESIPEDWYRYEAHCEGEPTVRRIPSG